MSNQDDISNNGIKARVVDWFVDKILPKALVSMFGLCVALGGWQVKTQLEISNFKEKATTAEEDRKAIKEKIAAMELLIQELPEGTVDLSGIKKDIENLDEDVDTINDRMDFFNSSALRAHLSRREANTAHRELRESIESIR